MSRCTGQCCRMFTLKYSPEDLERLASYERLAWVVHLEGLVDGTEEYAWPFDIGTVAIPEDVEQVADMVIPRGMLKAGATHPLSGQAILADVWAYDCKNLGADGDCTIYEDRPRMCRKYPRSRQFGICEYVGAGGCTKQLVYRAEGVDISNAEVVMALTAGGLITRPPYVPPGDVVCVLACADREIALVFEDGDDVAKHAFVVPT